MLIVHDKNPQMFLKPNYFWTIPFENDLFLWFYKGNRLVTKHSQNFLILIQFGASILQLLHSDTKHIDFVRIFFTAFTYWEKNIA